jgi:protein phosphatase PTC7
VFTSEAQQELSPSSRQKLLQFRYNKKLSDHPSARLKLLYSFRDPPLQLSATGGDAITDAKCYNKKNHGAVPVMAGDVVVVATDGLFNNLTEEQLQCAVRMGSRLGFSPKNMADLLVGVAYERSMLPFSVQLVQGKPDDITIVVAFVVQSPDGLVIDQTTSQVQKT